MKEPDPNSLFFRDGTTPTEDLKKKNLVEELSEIIKNSDLLVVGNPFYYHDDVTVLSTAILSLIKSIVPEGKKFDSSAKTQQQSDDRTYGYVACRKEMLDRLEIKHTTEDWIKNARNPKGGTANLKTRKANDA